MIKKYTKKPVTVEAVQWTGKNIDEMKTFMDSSSRNGLTENDVIIFLPSNQAAVYIHVGCWLIKDDGKFITCKPDVFAEKYSEHDAEKMWEDDKCYKKGYIAGLEFSSQVLNDMKS